MIPVYILFIGLLVLGQLMQSHASHLLPSLLRCCSCLLFLCRSSSGSTAVFTVSDCPLFWAFAASFILCIFCSACWDSLSACCACWDSMFLTFLTCDWSQLHAGIACLASLAYDWATACWGTLSVLLHAGIACPASLASDWLLTNGCFNSWC